MGPVQRKDFTEEVFKKIGKKSAKSLVVPELLESLMAVWGGPQKFANSFFTEFMQSPAGGMVRARMLSDVFRLFVVQSASLKGGTSSVEDLSDEELKAAVKELVDAPESISPSTPASS